MIVRSRRRRNGCNGYQVGVSRNASLWPLADVLDDSSSLGLMGKNATSPSPVLRPDSWFLKHKKEAMEHTRMALSLATV